MGKPTIVGGMNEQTNLTEQSVTPASQAPEKSKKILSPTASRRAVLFGGLGTLGVAGLGGGWAYDRFLREHTEISDVAAYEAQATSSSSSSATGGETELTGMTVADTGLTADNGSINLKTIVLNEGTSDQITAYTAEVKLGSASILRSAFAKNQFGLNIVEIPVLLPASTTQSGQSTVTTTASERPALWCVTVWSIVTHPPAKA